MKEHRRVERDALAEAAVSRAAILDVQSLSDAAAVKDAAKAFNREVVSIPDYLHYHPQIVLDALNLIKKICSDLIDHHGQSPKDPTHPVCILTDHDSPSAYTSAYMFMRM